MSNSNGRILIVDDDKFFCDIKSALLERNNYEVDSVQSADLVIEKLKSDLFDLVLLDLRIGDKSGIEVLREIKDLDQEIVVIMMTGFETVSTAVKAIQRGAYDYLHKKVKDDELLIKIERAIKKRKDSAEIRLLKDTIGEHYSFTNIIGANEQMKNVYSLIKKVCNTDATVLITGETGSGKELIAKAIHFNSQRKEKPFIAVNCAAISEHLMESELFGHEKGAFTDAFRQRIGKIEVANQGTLFLDEIGDMSQNLQAKLLRFLQDKTFERVGGNVKLTSDVRVIAATNKDLLRMIQEGRFREDLYYRINIIKIELPPLRDRLDDLTLLLDHFIERANIKFGRKMKGVSKEVLRRVKEYNWPGNVRELENLADRLVLISEKDIIEEEDVSRYFQTQEVPYAEERVDLDISLREAREEFEKKYLTGLLKKYYGNIKLVSEKAGMDRKAIFEKMNKHGLSKGDFKKPTS